MSKISKFFKTFFFLSVLSLNFLFAYKQSFFQDQIQNQIIMAAQKQFFSLPGFSNFFFKKINQGSLFELESALYAALKGEEVLWFNLDINIINGGVVLCGQNEFFNVNSAEFDIGTKNFVIECKSTKKPARCKFAQFRKERNIIAWFNILHSEFKNRTLITDISFSKNCYAILTVNSQSTGYENISMLSTWIKIDKSRDLEKEKKRCLCDWMKIIGLFEKKSLLILFKNKVGDKLHRKLKRENFEYKDQVRYKLCFCLDSSNRHYAQRLFA